MKTLTYKNIKLYLIFNKEVIQHNTCGKKINKKCCFVIINNILLTLY